jgi:iron(III) transport system substrate-binding protein
MHYLVALVCLVLAATAQAQDWEDRRVFNEAVTDTTLRVLSSTDTDLFAPLIERFVADNPEVGIEYLVSGTADIDKMFRAQPEQFDIVISSAMDLQFKLTNDGFALRLDGVKHPDWAQWRESLFAFTSEPAAIVINTAAFDGLSIPQSRQDLIMMLRARPDIFRGRVGTYDVRRSGLGYLFATQDSRASETYWRLMEVMGSLDVQLYCCSGEMIDDLTDGSIAVAYNVLGSYAAARVENGSVFELVELSDFQTTMMRTALVSNMSAQPAIATTFVQHVIDAQADPAIAQKTLPALVTDPDAAERSTIVLEPALMTYLDDLKRRKFLREWENAMIQE